MSLTETGKGEKSLGEKSKSYEGLRSVGCPLPMEGLAQRRKCGQMNLQMCLSALECDAIV